MADEQDDLDTYSEPRRLSGNSKHTEASDRGRAKLPRGPPPPQSR